MAPFARPPGVVIERFGIDQPIQRAAIDVPVFVVVAERGPLDQPTRIASWPEYVACFGGFTPTGLGAYAAKAFFDNGGRACWVVRVAAPATSTTTVGPQPADRRSSVVADVEGLAAGVAATVSQGGLQRNHLVTALDAATATVTWDRPLHPDIDVTTAIEVASGAAAASAPVSGAGGTCLVLSAASPGTWAHGLTVAVSPSPPSVTSSRHDEPSSRTLTAVRSTVGFEPGTSVVVSQDVGGAVTETGRVVAGRDRAEGLLRWEPPLPLAIDPALPLTIRSRRFTVSISERGVVREVFTDLQSAAGGSRFVQDVLATSRLVRVGAATGEVPLPQLVRLRSGRDGTAALAGGDFVGDELLAAGPAGRGLATTVALPEPAMVAIPDLVAPGRGGEVAPMPVDEADPCRPCQAPPAAPALDDVEVREARSELTEREVLRAQRAVVEHCERHTERIAVLDPAGGWGPLGVDRLVEAASRLPSSYAVLVAPWLAIVDPVVGTGTGPSRVPASAHYAGLVARTDADRGPWAAPANRPLDWVHGVGARFDDDQLARLNESGVVVVRPVPGMGLAPMGVRTLSADPLWLFLPVRRTMVWLRRTIGQALAWTAFEPLGAGLVALVGAQLDALLADVWADGGLAGDEPRQAYFVHVADPAPAASGELLGTIGVALARPAEFVTVQVRRSLDRLELVEDPERRPWP